MHLISPLAPAAESSSENVFLIKQTVGIAAVMLSVWVGWAACGGFRRPQPASIRASEGVFNGELSRMGFGKLVSKALSRFKAIIYDLNFLRITPTHTGVQLGRF